MMAKFHKQVTNGLHLLHNCSFAFNKSANCYYPFFLILLVIFIYYPQPCVGGVRYDPGHSANYYLEGGGGYSGETVTYSTADLVKNEIIVEEHGNIYRFTKDTKIEFGSLEDLIWVIPKEDILTDTGDIEPAEITRIRFLLDKSQYSEKIIKFSGEAIMKLEDNGIATVIPKDETNHMVRTLFTRSETLTRDLGDALKELDNLKRLFDFKFDELSQAMNTKFDTLKKDLNKTREDSSNLTGFVYGVMATLGTGVMAVLFSFAFNKVSKSRKANIKDDD
ncbi:MAG: hypothetical protein GY839_06375 [candidate division Zixibacteria bacterium]|nr:hypothetical protein [candidate division Zixibacteria bacterium]